MFNHLALSSRRLLLLLILSFSITKISSSTFKTKCPLAIPSESTYGDALVIAHRGASYHVPEHTLVSYQMGMELGADFVEIDLVATKDGQLIALHTLDLGITTDVSTVFGTNRMTKSSFDKNKTGYWVTSFDLEEVQQLTVKQRVPNARSTLLDGLLHVPTLNEILELVHTWNVETLPKLVNVSSTSPERRRVGLYVELKEPEWIQAETNYSMVDLLLQELQQSEHAKSILHDQDCQALKFDQYLVPLLVIESFDGNALKDLSEKWPTVVANYNNNSSNMTTALPLVQLTHASQCLEEDFWFETIGDGQHLQGIGPDQSCVLSQEGREFMTRAKERELVVHVWTERPEYEYYSMAKGFGTKFNSSRQKLEYLICQVGVDGVFAEDVSTAVQVVQAGCDDDKQETPVACPDTTTTATNVNSTFLGGRQALQEETIYMGFAAGVMGLFLGTLLTYWVSNSKYCRRRSHAARRQLAIPSHDVDLEMI